jgi:hypothetical protein
LRLKTILASVVTGLVVAGGAGAAAVAVTPHQFASLNRQVQNQQVSIINLKSQVAALQNTVSKLQANDTSSVVSCLQTQWNGLYGLPTDTYAINSAKYNSNLDGTGINGKVLLNIDPAIFTKC